MVQAAQEMALAGSPTTQPSRKSRSRSRATGHEHRDRDDDATAVNSTSHMAAGSSLSRSRADERTPLLTSSPSSDSVPHSLDGDHSHPAVSGHGHGSMNMRALLLHVFGDALGNVGVIATGLVIWLSHWSWKYYFDPMISLVITVIIFSSALPLGEYPHSYEAHSVLITLPTVQSTSFILLQGVPPTVSLDEVRTAILDVDGVLSLHELHVWQLSENKIVASVHVMASRNHDFMPVAAKIRKALHERGIHSSTIQPEYHARNAPPEEHLKVRCFGYNAILSLADAIPPIRHRKIQTVSSFARRIKLVLLKTLVVVRQYSPILPAFTHKKSPAPPPPSDV